jgi:hypothetical protein
MLKSSLFLEGLLGSAMQAIVQAEIIMPWTCVSSRLEICPGGAERRDIFLRRLYWKKWREKSRKQTNEHNITSIQGETQKPGHLLRNDSEHTLPPRHYRRWFGEPFCRCLINTGVRTPPIGVNPTVHCFKGLLRETHVQILGQGCNQSGFLD